MPGIAAYRRQIGYPRIGTGAGNPESSAKGPGLRDHGRGHPVTVPFAAISAPIALQQTESLQEFSYYAIVSYLLR